MKKSLVLCVLLFTPALAQNNPASSSPLSSVFNQIAQQIAGEKPAPTASAKPVSDAALTYKPSSKVSSDLRNTMINISIARTQKNGTFTPALEKGVRDIFGKIDIAAEYQKLLKPKGYNVYNVATATTLYIVSAFEILDDMQTTDATDKMAYDQFKRAFAAVPAVAQMTDEDKQKFAEALMWLTALQTNEFVQAKKGTKGYRLENVRDSVKTALKSFNIDSEKVQVGKKGLEVRK